MINREKFCKLKRQKFRDYFQPSRILLLCVKDQSHFNVTTLCFSMHGSYKPSSIVFALEKRHKSYQMIGIGKKCVLAIPGENLASFTLNCGVRSAHDFDKVANFQPNIIDFEDEEVFGLGDAISNIEGYISSQYDNGDHDLFVFSVKDYWVDLSKNQPGLLSIGSNEDSYRVLKRSGIHRIAVPK